LVSHKWWLVWLHLKGGAAFFKKVFMDNKIEIGGKLEIENASIIVNKINDINNSEPTGYCLILTINFDCSIGEIKINSFQHLVKHQLNESDFNRVKESFKIDTIKHKSSDASNRKTEGIREDS
jgi:hypothetical protein